MKLLFILDPLASLKVDKDTSVAMMREAAARGHEIIICQQHDLFLRNQTVKINAQLFQFCKEQQQPWFKLAKHVDADAVLDIDG